MAADEERHASDLTAAHAGGDRGRLVPAVLGPERGCRQAIPDQGDAGEQHIVVAARHERIQHHEQQGQPEVGHGIHGDRADARVGPQPTGRPADLAAAVDTEQTWTTITLTRYGVTTTVHTALIDCLWHGSLGHTPVHVVLVREVSSTKPYDIAVVTTDRTATPVQVVERYADRWAIEQAIKDSKDLLGAGDAQNRLPAAVERTVPFGMLTLTILTLWYHHAGTAREDLAARLAAAPWYRHKRHIAVLDMLIAFRRSRITATTASQATPELNDHPALAKRTTAA